MTIREQLVRQAGWCSTFGSPLYAYLLSRAADSCEGAGPLRLLLADHASDPATDVLPLRLMGAVHRLVLEGWAPSLAACFPSVGGSGAVSEAWPLFHDAIRDHLETLRQLIKAPVQTNDVGRSGSLLGGFGLIARRTGLPLRLLEVGCSAGLNLRWDRFRFEWEGGSWGDPASAVRLCDVIAEGNPEVPAAIPILERSGCDLAPIDAATEAGRLTLRSYVWADQLDRLARLDAAIRVADAVPCAIDRAHAADWLAVHLRSPVPDVATVVFHSVMWEYLSAVEQGRITATLERAGSKASARAPLAWLRMEPHGNTFEIRLRLWPGPDDRVIATTRAHAPSVRWIGP